MKFLKKISLLLLIYILSNVHLLFSQTLNFKHYAVKDGVSQSVINCIYQDSEGFIWFGTQNGLNKFDGYFFEQYFFDPTDTNSISNNWIFDIAEDNDGYLWIATKKGLNKFDKKTSRFRQINYKKRNSVINDHFVYGLTTDEYFLYINTAPILTILNIKTETFETFKNNFEYDGAVHDIGSPIIKDNNGTIWIGSLEGLYNFNLENKKFTGFKYNEAGINSISHRHITALFEDRSGNITIGTANGLNIYSKKDKKIAQYFHDNRNPNSLSHSFIRSIIQDHTGAYWIGTEDGGLNKMTINNQTGRTIYKHYGSGSDNQNFISHDIVYSLFEDKSNNLWVGTIAGIDKIDLKKEKFRSYKKSADPNSVNLLDNIIASVYKDQYGSLWIGNWGKGLNIFNRKTNEVKHYSYSFTGKNHIPDNHVHVIFKDRKSRIWLGTRNGLSIFNKLSSQFIPAHEYFGAESFNKFKNNRVYCMIEDRKGDFWIGTANGIFILNISSKSIINFRSDNENRLRISSNLVYSILEDKDKNIWIATSNGLNCYIPSENKVNYYSNITGSANTLCDNFTISLCEDNMGLIWIGTSTGVNSFNKTDSIFTYYSMKNGLPSNIAYDIIEDDNHNLWFSTGSGLAIFDTQTETFKAYSIEDGLQGMEFNIKAVFKADDGEMFFGGIEGLISFYPDSLKDNKYVPPVVITSFEKERDDKKQKVNVYSDKIALSYKDYSFTIKFSAFDYSNPSRNKYAYRMEGISDKWISLDNQRFVHFTNLPPGNYTFHVKGTNSDGIWNDTTTGLDIIIYPPWWKSKPAYISYLVLIILLIIIIVKRRERNMVYEKKMLENKVTERTAEIALQKDELNELNATKDKFFSILAHDLKNPFASLYSLSDLLKDNYKSTDEEDKIMIIQKINSSAKHIFSLLESLLTWSRSQSGLIEYAPVKFDISRLININLKLNQVLAEKKGIKLLNSTDEKINAFGDKEMISTVIRNLINNAVKYTNNSGTVEVKVQKHDEYLEVSVCDEGIGISSEDQEKLFQIDVKYKTPGTSNEMGTGLGLILCREFVEKNNGKIWVESELSEGSCFTFTLPIKK